MEERVSFKSGNLNLAGIVHTPKDAKKGERRPAFLVLHGFGSNKASHNCTLPCEFLNDWGYVAMRFDYRGCGESDGEKARIICLEQVEDTSAALTYMASRPDVDPDRIAVIGSSFGAAVAVYTGGVDKRVAAVVSSGGWGDGERKFRGQHPTPEAWARFTKMLADGKEHRAKTGTSLMVSRYDIVPIPPNLRGNLAPDSVMEFPAETAQSMFDFRADEVVGNIAPRPLLLLHTSHDTVTPTEQSIEMFKRAKDPVDMVMFSDTTHFMFAAENVRVRHVLKDWLDKYFPAKAKVAA